MLILARRVHESIMIGEDIRIELVGIDLQTIRLGIDAPRDIPVHREEVFRKIKRASNQFYLPRQELYI
jgi:carbon storage regulator